MQTKTVVVNALIDTLLPSQWLGTATATPTTAIGTTKATPATTVIVQPPSEI